MKQERTVMISVRIPPDLLADIDAIAREMAYHEGRRINRNSLLIEVLRRFVEQRSAQK